MVGVLKSVGTGDLTFGDGLFSLLFFLLFVAFILSKWLYKIYM